MLGKFEARLIHCGRGMGAEGVPECCVAGWWGRTEVWFQGCQVPSVSGNEGLEGAYSRSSAVFCVRQIMGHWL